MLKIIVYLALEYAAIIIAESIYNQVNDDGHDNTLFDGIIGHEYQPLTTDTPITNENFVSKSTEGWKICLEWADGSSLWHPIIDVKNSFLMQLVVCGLWHKLQG
jgi:hypothetical protein